MFVLNASDKEKWNASYFITTSGFQDMRKKSDPTCLNYGIIVCIYVSELPTGKKVSHTDWMKATSGGGQSIF